MNLKKILVLLLFFVALTCILTPVDAKLNTDVSITTLKNTSGNTQLSLSVDSDIGMKSKKWRSANSVSKRKAEINKVNKVVVSIKGSDKVTFKKPAKGWKMYKFDYTFNKQFSAKGKVLNKAYTIKLYDKKNKLIRTKKGKIKYSSTTGSMSSVEITNNPEKYFNELKSKNKKDKYYSFQNFKQLRLYYYYYNQNRYENLLNTSSDVSYYYNKNSMFTNKDKIFRYNHASLIFKTKNPEKYQKYVKGDYQIIIQTTKNSDGIFKHVYLYKNVNDTLTYSIKNPYFNLSKYCDWNHQSIKNLANAINASVPYNSNIDIYRMELANAVIRYLHINISYDYRFSKDQSALTTLQRKSGTCLGNTMLAGALLRALDIPVYFQTSYKVNKTDVSGYEGGHIWVVAYLFYEGKYQWVPAEPTHDYTKRLNEYNNALPFYRTPFYKEAADWFIIGGGGKYFFPKGYGYWYDEIAFGKIS